jgi:ABC-type Fe3+-hydroxamate transport system substrate-binding protein
LCASVILDQLKSVLAVPKSTLRKIRLLKPDIIICNKEENTQEIVERLSEICPVWVTNIITIEDNFQIISDFGQLLTVEPKRRNGMINWLCLE